MTNHGTGWVRMESLVPARGLIGFRTEFLTDTRGTGIAHHVFEGYEPWFGELRTRANGSLVADRSGAVTAVRDDQPAGARHAVRRADHRGVRGHDRRRELALRRHGRQHHQGEEAHQHARRPPRDETETLVPPRKLSLEQALEFCREDECVEVTPEAVRIRKVVLTQKERVEARPQERRPDSDRNVDHRCDTPCSAGPGAGEEVPDRYQPDGRSMTSVLCKQLCWGKEKETWAFCVSSAPL